MNSQNNGERVRRGISIATFCVGSLLFLLSVFLFVSILSLMNGEGAEAIALIVYLPVFVGGMAVATVFHGVCIGFTASVKGKYPRSFWVFTLINAAYIVAYVAAFLILYLGGA